MVPYCIQSSSGDSSGYYSKVAELTDLVLATGKHKFLRFLPTWTTQEEAILELLTIGILWQVYGRNTRLGPLTGKVFSQLNTLRHGKLKPGIDFIRGYANTSLLSTKQRDPGPLTVSGLNSLLRWLDATGEFPYEIPYLLPWSVYIKKQADKHSLVPKIHAFADWFAHISREVLGQFTVGVEEFRASSRKHHRWQEDFILCQRHQVEYHLNMVGAHILSRVFRPAFLATKEKAVLLPACLRPTKNNCQAIHTPLGWNCQGCSPMCSINKITTLGQERNFRTFFIHHNSAWGKDAAEIKNLGIIGISCVLGLISGGRKAQSLGVPAQCVVLDFCGCKRHWHPTGIPTTISVNQLKALLNSPD